LADTSRFEYLLPCVSIFVRESQNNLVYRSAQTHEAKQTFEDLLKVLCSCMVILIKMSLRQFCSACSLVGTAGTAAGRQSAVFFMKIFHQLTN
jgi:hypothetical protein